jgi:hypothetical protein
MMQPPQIELDLDNDQWSVKDTDYEGSFAYNKHTGQVTINWTANDLPDNWEDIEHAIHISVTSRLAL